ncbi:MAG TPA: nuclear transport factor 2 family protein, partial [Burkholderiaceae bacterium]|nr:nuclear transport factor 2 family protein [Burkholderiaceae bacterium]
MNTYLLCLSLVLLPTVPCMAADAQPPHASRPGVMVTREVKQFGDLERDLIAAINAKDADGIGQLLADDFALHVGNNPADPTNRAEMIAQAMAGNALPTHFEHISAHDFGNVAVVSFSWNLDG